MPDCPTGSAPSPVPVQCVIARGSATHAAHAFDAEDLRAAALPQSELGAQYSSFEVDWFFGGFESNEERARDKSGRPEEERRVLEQSGRLAGYQQMYVPVNKSGPVVRIFTLVGLFRDAAGASAYLEQVLRGGDFALSGLGDEARGTRRVEPGGAEGVLTRAYVRRGPLLGTVGINRRDDTNVNGEVAALAQKLDERLRMALTGALRGYTGQLGTETGAERVQRVALPRVDLGPAYSTFEEDHFLNGFQDNSERATSSEEYKAFERCGRTTGYFEAFRGAAGLVSTGAHLFGEQAGATDYLAGSRTAPSSWWEASSMGRRSTQWISWRCRGLVTMWPGWRS